MEPQTTAEPDVPSGNPPGTAAPDLERLATDLAARHAAAGGVSPKVNRGGRRTAAEEVADYCARNGLRLVPEGEGAPDAAPDPGPAYVVTPEFVRTCTGTLLRGVEAFSQRQVFLKALTIGADANLAKELAGEAGAPPGAIDVMSLCMAEIAQKYDFLAASTPEVLLVVAGATWGGRYLALMRRLSRIEAEQKRDAKDAKDGAKS
jgi:hypothetical protein